MTVGVKRREKITKLYFMRKFSVHLISESMHIPRDIVAGIIMQYTVDNFSPQQPVMISPRKMPYFENEKEMMKGPGKYSISSLSKDERKLASVRNPYSPLPGFLISDNETVGRKQI